VSVRILIDGRPAEAAEGGDLLSACLSAGADLPYFCWHPAMGSVGACRQCAVRVRGPDGEDKGLAMACMTGVEDDLQVEIADPEAAAFRAGIVEQLMLDHPHDCPVCPEGGACHLQDMTLMTGHRMRRAARGPKRTHRDQDLGPFLTHHMNRCIACYRCTRFYRDVAGGRDLDVFGARDGVFFGRSEDGTLESPFAGNLAEICPTGVFNDKPMTEAYVRKWDLESAPAVCPHCAQGCNLTLSARKGVVKRAQTRFNPDVNGFFLCDRGRFGVLFAAAETRLRAPRIAGRAAEEAEAVAAAREALAEGAVGLGSPRASAEANWALRRLVGPARFFAGVSDAERARVDRAVELLKAGPAGVASLPEIEDADAVLVLGEDVAATAPRLELALRRAAESAGRAAAREAGVPAWHDAAVRTAATGRRTPFATALAGPSPIEALATRTMRGAPAEIAAFGFAVARALGGDDAPEDARAVAAALAAADRPLVVSGCGLEDDGVPEAAAAVAAALGRRARIVLAAPEAGSVGLSLIGAPGGVEAAAAALEAGPARTLVILENTPERRADPAAVARLYAAAERVVALDHSEGPTLAQAGVVLPVASVAEAGGTFVSHAGRAQRSFAVAPEAETAPAAWRRLGALAGAGWRRLDDVLREMAGERPELGPLAEAAPGADWRGPEGRAARAPRPYSARTAMTAHRAVEEPAPPPDPDAPFAFSMEGSRGWDLPPALFHAPRAPGWTSINALHRFQEEVRGPLRGGVPGARAFGADPLGLDAPSPPSPATPERPPPATPERPAPAEGLVPVLLHAVFAGEELSALSPPVATRAGAEPREARLHPEEAAGRGLGEGDRVAVRAAGVRIGRARVALDPRAAKGTVGLTPGATAPRGLTSRIALEPEP